MSLIAGSGSGDVVQFSATAERERIPIRIVSIPTEFDLEPDEPLDRDYIGALCDFGYAMGLDGAPWRMRPSGFEQFGGASSHTPFARTRPNASSVIVSRASPRGPP